MKKLSEIKENVLFQHCGQARVKEAIKLLNSLTSDVCYAGKQGSYYGIVNGGVTSYNKDQLNMALKNIKFKNISVDQFISLFTESAPAPDWDNVKFPCYVKCIGLKEEICRSWSNEFEIDKIYLCTGIIENNSLQVMCDSYLKYCDSSQFKFISNFQTAKEPAPAPEPSNLEVIFLINDVQVARTDFDKLRDFHKFLKENENASVIIQKKESEFEKFKQIIDSYHRIIVESELEIIYNELKQLFQK